MHLDRNASLMGVIHYLGFVCSLEVKCFLTIFCSVIYFFILRYEPED